VHWQCNEHPILPSETNKNPLHPSNKSFILMPITVGWHWWRWKTPSLIIRWSRVQVLIVPHLKKILI